ncbi:hypothetical protein FAEPRAM212_02499 [Faecalibacterium prausnitzii M21/2]|uniref:Uncharacterized protein n=1 Tax=Faecalibacterium prausnitzii M21/2 TaxID=411485 RepID=A8SEN8_9FIRM|nr:hypothetical protein FAEPRAM212_02499 [Faecalibacterium prausnitzii M21/2]
MLPQTYPHASPPFALAYSATSLCTKTGQYDKNTPGQGLRR